MKPNETKQNRLAALEGHVQVIPQSKAKCKMVHICICSVPAA